MFTETDELDNAIDARFERNEVFAHTADEIEREAARIVRALRPPAMPEHGSIPDALNLISVLTHAAGSPRARLLELLATAFKLAFDHAEAEGATGDQMGDAAGMARSNVHRLRNR